MATSLQIEKIDRPELAKHDPSILDLVFVMDCTGSMASYIASATNNIRSIVEEIVVSEKSDVRLALIEYRDHPPQDNTFVTRVHDFTEKVSEMKHWLENCQAMGGGDTPEAVADGLHEVLKLSWRFESTKICVLIADAPPHGLDPSGDGFPNGCPAGLDPLKIVREMAEKHITLYTVGVEPPITRYRDFFMSLAYITGGQYVPMVTSKLLAKVIIGGVREEMSLERLMQDAQADIDREMQKAETEGVDEKEKIKRINNIFSSKNMSSYQMTNTFGAMSTVATDCYSKCANMAEMQSHFASKQPAVSTTSLFGAPVYSSSSSSFTFGTPVQPTVSTTIFGAPIQPTTSSPFSFGAPIQPTVSTTSIFGAPTQPSASTTSLFGAPIQPTTSSSFTFGTPVQPAVSNISIFGATTQPTVSNTSAFGAPTQPTASSSFTFGTPVQPAVSNTSIFGATTQPTVSTTSAFGASAQPTASSTFSFGTYVPSESEMNYDLIKDAAVSEEQAARVYQKWQNRKK